MGRQSRYQRYPWSHCQHSSNCKIADNGWGLTADWNPESERCTRAVVRPFWCQSDVAVSFRFAVCLILCCSCYCSVFFFSLLLNFTLFSAFWHHLPWPPYPPPPPKVPFFCPFLCLDSPIFVCVQSVPCFSGGCSFWANNASVMLCV